MKSVTGNGGYQEQEGCCYGPIPIKALLWIDLLNAVGGVASGQIVKFTGTDGYTSTVSYDQITSGGFTMYDASGNPATPTAKPTLAIVYFANGAALDSSTGSLEVGLLSSESLVLTVVYGQVIK